MRLLHEQIREIEREPEAGEDCLDAVHNLRSIAHQAVPLAVRPPCVLLIDCGNLRHTAMAPLAAQPAEKGAHQKLGVETIGLGAPVSARHCDARGMGHMSLDGPALQPARQPEVAASSLVEPGCSGTTTAHFQLMKQRCVKGTCTTARMVVATELDARRLPCGQVCDRRDVRDDDRRTLRFQGLP